jgi:hypothetical protein
MIAPIDCMMRVHLPMGRFTFESSLVADVIVMCNICVCKRIEFISFWATAFDTGARFQAVKPLIAILLLRSRVARLRRTQWQKSQFLFCLTRYFARVIRTSTPSLANAFCCHVVVRMFRPGKVMLIFFFADALRNKRNTIVQRVGFA